MKGRQSMTFLNTFHFTLRYLKFGSFILVHSNSIQTMFSAELKFFKYKLNRKLFEYMVVIFVVLHLVFVESQILILYYVLILMTF